MSGWRKASRCMHERGTVNWPAEDVRVAAPPEGHCGAKADSAILGPCALPACHDGTTHVGLNGIAWEECR